MTDLAIRITEESGYRVVHVNGEISIDTAESLKSVLLDQLRLGAPAVLNLSEVAAIDFSGLQLLGSAVKTFRRRGAGLELRGPSDCVLEAARLAGYSGSGDGLRFSE